MNSIGNAHVYRAAFGEDVKSFLLLDEAAGAVRVCDEQGDPMGGMMLRASADGYVGNPVDDPVEAENFTMAAAYLLARWCKVGAVPAEIGKVFS